jgi:alkyldihydroxyacetonephosphate synthase
MPNRYPEGDLAAPAPIAAALLDDLRAAGLDVDTSTAARAEHARDWWPRSLPSVARGEVAQWPGAVVRPRSTDQVSATLRVASAHRIAVTAQGGRSGVVGGAVPSTGALALDLTGLNRVLAVDAASQTVRVEAGVFGPDLEERVRAHGLTVGHFPQSFDLATVGGWIACRGAGQYSNRYGTVADMVRGLTVVLSDGTVVSLGDHGPRAAVGPDLTQLFIGSEGTLGVVTEASLVLHARPPRERRAAYLFGSFAEGLSACRRTLQREARPAVLRLYDEAESRRHFDVEGCALVVLDEGEEAFLAATMGVVAEECADATPLDEALVERWLVRRNDVGALAPLWARGIVVDTIETAGPWSLLGDLHLMVRDALASLPDMLVVSVHQSHAYLDGACLYFTFAGQPGGDAEAFYRSAWDHAMGAVLAGGGSLSHHHGIGRNRARFVADALGSAWPLLEGLKERLDPHHLLNPGVLGLGGPPW